MAVSAKMRKKLQKRQKELATKGGGKFNFMTFKEGTTRVRLLPIPEDSEFGVEVTYFFPNTDIGSIISPATFGEPCALMEAYERLKKSKDENDQDSAKLVAPKRRYMVFGYKYQDEKGKQVDMETGAKLMLLTNSVYQEIIDLYLDEDEAGDMTDAMKGYDLKIKRTGKGQFDTEYTVRKCNPTKRDIKFKGVIQDHEEAVRKVAATYEKTQEVVETLLGSSKKKTKKPIKKVIKKKKTR